MLNPVATLDELVILDEVWCLLLFTDEMSFDFVDSLKNNLFSLIC